MGIPCGTSQFFNSPSVSASCSRAAGSVWTGGPPAEPTWKRDPLGGGDQEEQPLAPRGILESTHEVGPPRAEDSSTGCRGEEPSADRGGCRPSGSQPVRSPRGVRPQAPLRRDAGAAREDGDAQARAPAPVRRPEAPREPPPLRLSPGAPARDAVVGGPEGTVARSRREAAGHGDRAAPD